MDNYTALKFFAVRPLAPNKNPKKLWAKDILPPYVVDEMLPGLTERFDIGLFGTYP